jgi:hypothetical protein
MHRRLPAFFDRPTAPGFRLSRQSTSLRGCPIKVARVSSPGLVFGTAHHLVLMEALNSPFTNAVLLLPLAELINTRIAGARAL